MFQCYISVLAILFLMVCPISKSLGQVVINEIMYHSQGNDLEFIELYNSTSQSVDLSGWIIKDSDDSHQFTIPPDIHIDGEGFFIITDDLTLFQNIYGFSANIGGLPFDLGNDGDMVRLFDPMEQLIERVHYDDRRPWPEAADGGGGSLERLNTLLPAFIASSWDVSKETNGSPGQANTNHQTELKPIITHVNHTPTIPRPNQPVTVSAKIVDVDGEIQEVLLFYGEDRGNQYESVPMFDDGEHEDGLADDGVYGTNIPGNSVYTILRFYLQASDQTGQTQTFPLNPTIYPLLTVVEPLERDGELARFKVVMTPENHLTFLNAYRTDTYVPATFYDGDTVYYQTDIRHRGRSRSQNGRFKIRFPHAQLFREKMRRINLNGDSYNSLIKEYLSYQLYDKAGLPNLDSEIVTLTINGRQAGSIPHRVMIENPDAQFLRRKEFFGNDNGNLYKTTLDGTPDNKATWRYVGEDSSLYEDCYIKQTNESEGDWSDIIRFCKVLNQSDINSPDYIEQVYSALNADDFMRWMAVSACVAHWDSPYTDHGHNYVMYNNPDTQQFNIIAWDLNGTFNYSSNHNDLNYRKHYTHIHSTKFVPINKILNHPFFCRRYYQEISIMLQTYFSEEAMVDLIDSVGDQLNYSSSSMQNYKNYVRVRREDLAQWINDHEGITFISKPVYQTQLGSDYRYQAAAVDFKGFRHLTYELLQGPAWLSMDPDTGVLSGTPERAGNFDVEIRVAASDNIDIRQSFNLQVTGPLPRLILNFNDSNRIIHDLSEYNHQGDMAGGARQTVGRLGQGIRLDGNNDYIRIPHHEAFNLSGDITIEAWIEPMTTGSGNPIIISKGDVENFNYTLMLGYGPFSWDQMEPCFMPHPFDIQHRVYYGRKEIEARLRTRRWYHLAGTYNSSTEQVHVYVNNKRIVESSSRSLMPINSRDLLIGMNNSRCFNGTVDDVKILPFAKSAFAAGLCLSHIDISGISPAQDRIGLSLSPHRNETVHLGEYCFYFPMLDEWISLPDETLSPGDTIVWWLDNLGLEQTLPHDGVAILYPSDSKGNPSARYVLDQVVWGNPDTEDTTYGNQAAVWLPDRTISLTIDDPQSLKLEQFADNDEYDEDWMVTNQRLNGPDLVSVTIDSGNEITHDKEVSISLQFESTTPIEMRLSNHPILENNWMPYQSTINWNLLEGDGIKHVYVQLRNKNGNRSAVKRGNIRLIEKTRIHSWQKYE